MSYNSTWTRPGHPSRGDSPAWQLPVPTEAQEQLALLHIVQAGLRAKERAQAADDEETDERGTVA